jgi:hypothetical protein
MRTRLQTYSVHAALALLLAGFVAAVGVQTAHADGPVAVPVSKVGTASLVSAPYATDSDTQNDQIDLSLMGDADGTGGDDAFQGITRTLVSAITGNGRPINPQKRAKSNPQLVTHFQGLNFHDQRFANGGNQFSVEPPDQALCAGNGFVVESVNDVIQVYDSVGNALLNGGQAVDLNTFYGYPAAINRTTGARGPSITDPVCIYDQAIGRFV